MKRTRRARVVAVAVGAVALLAASCSGSTSHEATGPTSTSLPNGVTASCAWANRADKATMNIAYPDTSATYWGTAYRLLPGQHLELTGTYPDARYFSFVTYGPEGGAIHVLTDRDIAPNKGSVNPFAGGSSTGHAGERRYTLRIAGTGVTSGGNVLHARASGSTATDTRGSVLYRVYLPTATSGPTGAVGLPHVTVVNADGTRRPVPTCAHPGANPRALRIVNDNGPATDTPAPEQPIFVRPKGSGLNLYPNPDNIYVATIVAYRPGRIVVVRGKAPTFPDTRHGYPVTGREQVRYWSLCTDEYRKPYPVSTCAPDDAVVLDGQRRYTFVISTPADRPANATAANGVTWLDWGSTKVDGLLILRNMLADPSFPQSAINVEPGALAASSMGDYAPRGTYCEAKAFAAQGPSACPG